MVQGRYKRPEEEAAIRRQRQQHQVRHAGSSWSEVHLNNVAGIRVSAGRTSAEETVLGLVGANYHSVTSVVGLFAF
jgi:hypothetical protein